MTFFYSEKKNPYINYDNLMDKTHLKDKNIITKS